MDEDKVRACIKQISHSFLLVILFVIGLAIAKSDVLGKYFDIKTDPQFGLLDGSLILLAACYGLAWCASLRKLLGIRSV